MFFGSAKLDNRVTVKATGVRELFDIIASLREKDKSGADHDHEEGEEEEELEQDDCVEEKDVEEEAATSSEKEDDAAKDSAKDGDEKADALADDGSGAGTVPLDGPIHRLRAKSTFSLTATSDVASKEHLLATGASYEGALSPSKEEQLNQLLQQISLFEDGSPKDGRTAHHDAMLLLMGSPSRATKPQGPRFALTFLVAAL